MKSVNVAEAKAHLSEILSGIESGGEIMITRRGRPVARLSAIQQPRKPINFAALDSLRARQKTLKTSSVRVIRKMREEKY